MALQGADAVGEGALAVSILGAMPITVVPRIDPRRIARKYCVDLRVRSLEHAGEPRDFCRNVTDAVADHSIFRPFLYPGGFGLALELFDVAQERRLFLLCLLE